VKNLRIDFHIHTFYSLDSTIDPKKLIEKSKELGVVPAICDHNSISSHKHFSKIKKVILGEEIRTDIGDLIGYYVNELIPKNTPFLEALDKIKQQGGLSCLPHGFDKIRYNIGGKYPEYAKKVDIIEGFNSRCIFAKSNDLAKAFAKKYKKPTTCGTDSHFLFEFAKSYSTLPDFDIENPKELLKALKKAKHHEIYFRKSLRFASSVYARIRKAKRLFFRDSF